MSVLETLNNHHTRPHMWPGVLIFILLLYLNNLPTYYLLTH